MRFATLLVLLASVGCGWDSMAEPTWTALQDDTFQRANTSVGGAGTTTGAGNSWIDVQGNVWQISSNKLLGTSDAVNTTSRVRDFLLRNAAFAQIDERIDITITSTITANLGFTAVHRYQPSGGPPPQHYICGITPGGTLLLIAAVAATTGTATVLVSVAPSPVITGGHTYKLTSRCWGTSPTNFAVDLIDVTAGNTNVATLTTTDSTVGLQIAGQLGITLNDGATGQAQSFSEAATYMNATVVPVTDAKAYFSPGNWYSDGGGSYGTNNVKGSSTYALTNTPGAYLKLLITASATTGSAFLQLDTSILTGITAGNTPVVVWSLDGGALSQTQLIAVPTTSLALGSSLAIADHTLELWFQAIDTTSTSSMGDRWNTATTDFSGVKVTNILLAPSTTLSAPTVGSTRAIWYGDSSLEAIQNVTNSLTITGQDASQSYGILTATGLNIECGLIGFSGQGYEVSTYGNVPSLYNVTQASSAWPYYFSGALRTSQPLDWIICNHGINGTTTSGDVQGWITQVRAAYPSAKIIMMDPWDQINAAAISAGVAAYKAAVPTDANVFYITMPVNLGTLLYSLAGASIHHPNVRGDAQTAAYYLNGIKAALGGGAILSRVNSGW